MPTVLIIDDCNNMCLMLSTLVERMGHTVSYVKSMRDGFDKVRKEPFDVVLLDINLPDGNGLDAIPIIRENPHPPEIIIMTGHATVESAELAIKNGVWDFIQKPLTASRIKLILQRVFQYCESKRQMQTPMPALPKRQGIIGSSPQMRICRENLARAATSRANVLLHGETGTGKDVFARAIHQNSTFATKPFVIVDCAALPDSLVESILFGHEKGAFTGAEHKRQGLVEKANGGFLFLDEIGDLNLSMQKTFLRVLQDQKFRPVGSNVLLKSNFRLIAATHKNLERLVVKGEFREDLFFRLRGITIELPPLRNRLADIPELVTYLLTNICNKNEVEPKHCTSDFLENLKAYHWPGNVRELIHALEDSVSRAFYEPCLYIKHLPEYIRIHLATASISKNGNEAIAVEPSLLPGINSRRFPTYSEFKDFLFKKETDYLQDLLRYTDGNIKEATQISGLSRTWLYNLLKKHDVARKNQR